MRDLERREFKDEKKTDAVMKRDLVDRRETSGQIVKREGLTVCSLRAKEER